MGGDVFVTLLDHAARDALLQLPHGEHAMAKLVHVAFGIRAPDVCRHLKDTCSRSHVVLELRIELIKKRHQSFFLCVCVFFCAVAATGNILERYACLVEQRYPVPGHEKRLPPS